MKEIRNNCWDEKRGSSLDETGRKDLSTEIMFCETSLRVAHLYKVLAESMKAGQQGQGLEMRWQALRLEGNKRERSFIYNGYLVKPKE